MSNNIQIGWNLSMTLCVGLSEELIAWYKDISNFEIVTVARGGLIPATLIAHHLDIKKVHVWFEGMCPKSMPDEDKRLIFIDDILDTRRTFERIREVFVNYDVKYAFLVSKMQNLKFVGENPGIRIFIGKWVENKWVEFPWEQKIIQT